MLPTAKQALVGAAMLATGALAQVFDWGSIPLGCVTADLSGLPAPAVFPKNNEIVCATHCHDLNFRTAATQANRCYCGPADMDGLERDNQDDCNIVCPGAEPDFPDEPCGGDGTPAVYNYYAIYDSNDPFPDPDPPVVIDSSTSVTATSSAMATASSDPELTLSVDTTSTTASDTVSTPPPSTTSPSASASMASSMTMSDDEGVLPGGGTELSTVTTATTITTFASNASASPTMTMSDNEDADGILVTETATSTRTTTTCTHGLCNGGSGYASPTGMAVLPAGWKIFIEITIVPLVEPCADGRLTTTMAPSAATRYYDPSLSTTTVIVEDTITRTILVPVTRVAIVTQSPWRNGTGKVNGSQEMPVQANGAAAVRGELLRGLVSLIAVVGAVVMW